MKQNTKKIIDEMKRLGITQSDMARRMKCTRQNVWFVLKHGSTTFRIIEKIAKILNLDPKDLII